MSGADVTTDATAAWFWEGNVVNAIAAHLEEEGWRIVGRADTHSRERGVDIRAEREGRVLLIEVKGFPSKHYRDPRRAGETKATAPTLQAQHWYSHALLKAMRLQTAHPDATVALGFPDFPRYRSLFQETRVALQKLGVALFAVNEHGQVAVWGDL
jgi:Holliday junction resolvase-like predicted endonuclease